MGVRGKGRGRKSLRLVLNAEPNTGLNLTNPRPPLDSKPRVGRPTDRASQEPLPNAIF